MPLDRCERVRWCITINNWSQADVDLLYQFKEFKMAMGQMEIGAEGTKHIQGWLVLLNPKRLKWLKDNLHPTAHFEKMKGTVLDNYNYCSKNDTRDPDFPEPWFYPSREFVESQVEPNKCKLRELVKMRIQNPSSVLDNDRYILHKRNIDEVVTETRKKMKTDELIKSYDLVQLKPWQQLLEIVLMKQTNRQVMWVFDPVGNVGKSWFMSYMMARHNWMPFDAKTSADSIGHMIVDQDPDGIMFDIPRADTSISWKTIEQLKNGVITTTKYRGFTGPIGTKKLLIFSNFAPTDLSVLSRDRWIIYQIHNDSLEFYLK